MSAGDHLNKQQFMSVEELKARAQPGDGLYHALAKAKHHGDLWAAHSDWMSDAPATGYWADSYRHLEETAPTEGIHTPVKLRAGQDGAPDTVIDGHHRIHIAEKYNLQIPVRYENP